MDRQVEWIWLYLETGGRRRIDAVVVARHLFHPHSLHYTRSISQLFNLDLSPQSSVQTPINGRPVAMVTSAHRTAGARHGMPLFLFPFSICPALPFKYGLALFLTFSLSLLLPKQPTKQFHFVSSHLPPHVVLDTHTSLSPTLLSSLCVTSVFLSVCEKDNSPRMVESRQSHLSCRRWHLSNGGIFASLTWW